MKFYRLTGGLLALWLPALGWAHHAFTPVYAGDRSITIEGTVTQFRYINPHAMMTVEVADDAGSMVAWNVEMAGVLSISRMGWTATTVRPGDRVTVSGNPMHSGASGLFLRKIVLPDGTELFDPGDADRNAVDELRRQRARERELSSGTE